MKSQVAKIFIVGKKVATASERHIKEVFKASAARLEVLERDHNDHAWRDKEPDHT